MQVSFVTWVYVNCPLEGKIVNVDNLEFWPEGVPDVSKAPEAFRDGEHQWEMLHEGDKPSLFLVASEEIEWSQILGWQDDCIQVKTNESWEYWDNISEDSFPVREKVEARYLHYSPGIEIVD